jgi:hypothetical protein
MPSHHRSRSDPPSGEEEQQRNQPGTRSPNLAGYEQSGPKMAHGEQLSFLLRQVSLVLFATRQISWGRRADL